MPGFIVEDFFFFFFLRRMFEFSVVLGRAGHYPLLFRFFCSWKKKLTTPCVVESSCILEEAARSENLAIREYFVITFRSSDRLRSWDFPQLLHVGFQLFKVTWWFHWVKWAGGGSFVTERTKQNPEFLNFKAKSLTKFFLGNKKGWGLDLSPTS